MEQHNQSPSNDAKRRPAGPNGRRTVSCTSFSIEFLEDRCMLSSYPVYPAGLLGMSAPYQGPDPWASVGQSAALDVSPFPAKETFFLHSRPGAEKIIFLDFDGHTIRDTKWNDPNPDEVGDEIPTIVMPPMSIDLDFTFNELEFRLIQEIWETVSEDFRPFDVDVTTEDPGSDVIAKNGVRVCIGDNNMTWFGGDAGGVAYLNTFAGGEDLPAIVFEDNAGNGVPKYIGDVISHEVGHTLGLYHDGLFVVGQQDPTEYYVGHGQGLGSPTSWAPIMGSSYDQTLSQWSKGEYPNAVTMWPPEDPPVPRLDHQDDLDVISMILPFREDDHGNEVATASEMESTGTRFFGEGVIEQSSDVDFLSFRIGVEEVVFDIRPFHINPNLDILAKLHDSTGKVLATSNPRDDVNASFSINTLGGTQLTPGAYYISIDGTGKPFTTDPGYSDYGSLGYFTISGTRKSLLDVLTGVDFDVSSGSSPTNWTRYTGGGPAVFSDLRNESGTRTPYNLSISSTTTPVTARTNSLNKDTIPFHTQTLVGVGGSIVNTGAKWTFIWSDLEPLTVYEIYVFAANDAPGGNLVEIAGNGNSISFAQSLSANDLVINNQVGSADRPLIDYARTVQASATGEIRITVTNDTGATESAISGLAIRPGTFGSISGLKWNDENGDGIRDESEPGLPGWTIYFDDNDNGVLDSTFSTTTPSVDVPQAVDSYTTVKSELLFEGVREILDLNVRVDITHTFAADVNVVLISPSGTRVELFSDVGGFNDNFTNTVLDDEASMEITAAAAPFNGIFRPEGDLSDFDGENANGIWILEITDDAANDSGVLNNWSITITGSERSTVTRANGTYSFEDLPPGVYNVKEVIDSGANTASSVDVPRTLRDPGTITSELEIEGAGQITDVNVNLDITHTWISDLSAFLISPSGTRVELFTGVGADNDNFTNTVLDDEATTSITLAMAPFTGTFRPVGALSAFDGENADGTWLLELTDAIFSDVGVLNSWALSFSGAVQSTWVQTLGQPPVTVSSGGRVTGVDFGNREGSSQPDPGSIAGQVWNDTDGDGEKDAGEPGLPDWTIYVDGNDNGVYDASAMRTVESTAVPEEITDFSTVTSELTFNGLDSLTDISVTLDITHSFDGDLEVYLISPAGTQVELFSGVGGQFNNFHNTTLNQDAALSISEGTAPFSGTYRPEGLLSDFLDENPNGIWRLLIRDTTEGDEGTINSWSLTIEGQELSTVTDAEGNYSFDDIVPGSYLLRQVLQPGWTATHSPTIPIDLGLNQQLMDVDFGNRQSPVALPGDYNNDDVVDLVDYVAWRKSMNQAVPPFTGADGDGDGMVDQDDYLVWRAHFGMSRPVSGGGSAAIVAVVESAGGSTQSASASLVAVSDDVRTVSSARQNSEATSKSGGATRRFIAEADAPSAAARRPAHRVTPRDAISPRLGDAALLAWLAAQSARAESPASADDEHELFADSEDQSPVSVDRVFETLGRTSAR